MSTTQDAAAIRQGVAEAYMVESPIFERLISLMVTEALGEEHARELRRDQAVCWAVP